MARLRHLENHTQAVDLYVMNLHLNRVDICCHPMDDRFISKIVTCEEKSVYYRNPNVSKQWLGPSQPVKIIVKNIGSSPR